MFLKALFDELFLEGLLSEGTYIYGEKFALQNRLGLYMERHFRVSKSIGLAYSWEEMHVIN